MTPAARTVWKRIVGQYPPEHFGPEVYDTLRAYCEASALHKQAVKTVQKDGAIITQPSGAKRPHPAIDIMDKMACRMQGLITKLNIEKPGTGKAKPSGKSKRAGLMFNGDK